MFSQRTVSESNNGKIAEFDIWKINLLNGKEMLILESKTEPKTCRGAASAPDKYIKIGMYLCI